MSDGRNEIMIISATEKCRILLAAGPLSLAIEQGAASEIPVEFESCAAIITRKASQISLRLCVEPPDTPIHPLHVNGAIAEIIVVLATSQPLPLVLAGGSRVIVSSNAPSALELAELVLAAEERRANKARHRYRAAVQSMAASRQQAESLHFAAGELAAAADAAKLPRLILAREISPGAGGFAGAGASSALIEQSLGCSSRGFGCAELHFSAPLSGDLEITLVDEEDGTTLADWRLAPGQAAAGWHRFALECALKGAPKQAGLRIRCTAADLSRIDTGEPQPGYRPARLAHVVQPAALAMRLWLALPGEPVVKWQNGFEGDRLRDIAVDQKAVMAQVALLGPPATIVPFGLLQPIDSLTFQLHPIAGHVTAAAISVESLLSGESLANVKISVRSASSRAAAMLVGVGLAREASPAAPWSSTPEQLLASFSGWTELRALDATRLDCLASAPEATHIIFLVKLPEDRAGHDFCWSHWSDLRLAAAAAEHSRPLHIARLA